MRNDRAAFVEFVSCLKTVRCRCSWTSATFPLSALQRLSSVPYARFHVSIVKIWKAYQNLLGVSKPACNMREDVHMKQMLHTEFLAPPEKSLIDPPHPKKKRKEKGMFARYNNTA